MTAVTWDDVGDKIYQAGIDRGVLYPRDAPGVAWNGLIGLDDSPNADLKSFFLEGVKYLENLSPGDFVGKLKAYTYPDEFEDLVGIVDFYPGFRVHEQSPKYFGLTYRSKIGNDVAGIDYGYRLHLLYNLLAQPESKAYETFTDSGVQPIEFSWSLTGTPDASFPGIKPTVHVTVDSLTTPPDILAAIEDMLYGADDDPRLPTLGEIAVANGFIGGLTIRDYGDGTWSARDTGGDYITRIDSTTYEIDGADIVVIDADSYDISSTPAP